MFIVPCCHTKARCWSLDLDPGSGTRISAKQQSHTEEYGVVHRRSNHTRKNTTEYGVLNRRIVETAVSGTTALMNIKVILQVAYMSAFRPSFCLNGSFARVFNIFRHRHTHTHTHTHWTHHSTPAQAQGNCVIQNYNYRHYT